MRRNNAILILLLAAIPHVSFADLFYDDGGTHTLSSSWGNIQVMDSLAGLSTTLNLTGGGTGDLRVYDTSIANVYGHGSGYGLHARDNSLVSVDTSSGFHIVDAYDDSTIAWSRGSIYDLTAREGAHVTITDGDLYNIDAHDYGRIDISDGIFRPDGFINANQGGQITISGARTNYFPEITSRLRVGLDATLTLYGSDFWSSNGGSIGYGELLDEHGHLTGTLFNGGTISSDYEAWSNGRIILAPEPEIVPVPSSVLLGGIGLAYANWKLRRRKTT
jgi:hypothetical protein